VAVIGSVGSVTVGKVTVGSPGPLCPEALAVQKPSAPTVTKVAPRETKWSRRSVSHLPVDGRHFCNELAVKLVAPGPCRFRAVLLGLSTGHAVGLALVAGAFIVFALVSALVIPRRWPQFPGHGLGWFIVATLVFFVATLGAVEVFAKEPKEEAAAAESATETGGTTTEATTTGEAQPPPAPAQGDPAAGKQVFAAQGCASCHTFSAAGSNGTVGPNLDEALKGKDAAFVKESIVDPNKVIASGYAPNVMPQDFGQKLPPKQIDDLVAFLLQG
jgi:mono/diheme cytochrome c family protein